MNTSTATKPTIVQLADRIEEDIRTRDLKPGDPYLGQVETKRMLGVGTSSANRALQLLAQRGVLVRKQRKGTFVARIDGDVKDSLIRRVHLVIPQDYLKKEGFFADGHVLGIQSELPQAEIVFSFLPEHGHAEFIEQLVRESVALSGVHAFILASSTFVTQQIMAGSGLPTVVGGSLYPSISGLPCIDDDHRLEAKLASEYLLNQGCKKFLLLNHEKMRPGERLFGDALREILGEAGVGIADLTVRNLTIESPEEIAAQVNSSLDTHSGKLGVMSRSGVFSEVVHDFVKRKHLSFGSDLEMVALNLHRNKRSEKLPYPYIRSTCEPQERGGHFGSILKKITNKEKVDNCVFPVVLVRPE